MPLNQFARAITAHLNRWLQAMPSTFCGTFEYTQTGNNFCHSLALGALASAVSQIDGVLHVGIDVRLNAGGCKFQPDVVGFGASGFQPMLCVDFESPNSSD